MKTRERKQTDLDALTEQLQVSKSAMIVGFNKLTVDKDQEFRNQLRDAGANYQVVKNTLARRAAAGTPYEQAAEHFKGVTAIAWTEADAVVLSKTVSKFIKENADIYSFKVGIVDGKVLDLRQVQTLANLPSKEELISKLLFVINAQAQRIVTVINAVPRNLAVVINQIGEGKTEVQAEQKAESNEEQTAAVGEVKAEETNQEETAPASEQNAEAEVIKETTPENAQNAEQETLPEAVPEAKTEEEKSE